MTLIPGYGETPVPDDELAHLRQDVRERLGEPVTKAAIYDLETTVLTHVTGQLLIDVVEGTLTPDDLISDHFLRDLHRQLYDRIWTWAGVYRRGELNLGVAPAQVAVDLRASLDTIRYRWEHTDDWAPRQLGIAVHAETVRIHPFADGNGRTTRLLADLVLAAAQYAADAETVEQYDWNLDKPRYIALLREYDKHRDPGPLAGFVDVREIGR